jgi:dTDP-4-amino-4,6-dideoxygalactose transaminase
MRPGFPDLSSVMARFEKINASGVFSNFGPQVAELSARFASFVGTTPEKVVAVSSATAGIQAAVASLGGERWAVPSWTFTATVAGTLGAGAQVILSDIDPETQWIDSSVFNQVDGTVAVAPFGSGFGDSLFNPRRRLVIDAAASIASQMPPLEKLPETNIVVFSLHATKVLGIGEGGLVVCGSADVAEDIRSRVNFGFAGGRESQKTGFNGKMSEFAAAVGHVVLDHWEEEREHWLQARRKVNALGAKIGLKSMFSDADSITPYWIVQFESPELRQSVEKSCEEEGIQTRQWWGQGCHAMPAYEGLERQDLRFTEAIAARYLGLPFYRGISDEDISTVEVAVTTGIHRV